MGNAHYLINRNGEQIEAGYAVATTCEQPGCETSIDRGLDYLCGNTPGGDETGCGGYFCGEHLFGVYEDGVGQQCGACCGLTAPSTPAVQR